MPTEVPATVHCDGTTITIYLPIVIMCVCFCAFVLAPTVHAKIGGAHREGRVGPGAVGRAALGASNQRTQAPEVRVRVAAHERNRALYLRRDERVCSGSIEQTIHTNETPHFAKTRHLLLTDSYRYLVPMVLLFSLRSSLILVLPHSHAVGMLRPPFCVVVYAAGKPPLREPVAVARGKGPVASRWSGPRRHRGGAGGPRRPEGPHQIHSGP